MSAVQNGPKQEDLVSSLPDYAQVFMFLRQFGELLAFPPVSLSELEDFFLTRHHADEKDKVVGIHWRLLMSVTRRENRRDWKKMATRFAVRSGVITQGLPYSDIPVEKRIHIMKLACEAQFDCNLPFKAELKKLELASDKPIGVDRFGHRYWLLQDSVHDVRLYRESEYDVMPPEGSSWALLARSINELDVRIANLVGKNEVSPEDKEEDKEEEEMEVDVTETDKCCMSQSQRMSRQTRVTSRAKKEGKKGSKKPPKAAAEGTGGCFVCRVDNDYQNMLLCDSCDGECHMYCHYPRLWMVPRGRWECPLCNEKALIERLKEKQAQLAVGRYQLEKAAERKQRNVIRLQKTGLLLQNIILNDSGTERTRRARKSVNYAELNDVYLPPLGPSDFIASGTQPSQAKPSGEMASRCTGTRASRRLRDLSAASGGDSEQQPVNRAGDNLNSGSFDTSANTDPASISPLSNETVIVSRQFGDIGADVEKQGKEFSGGQEASDSEPHIRSLAGNFFDRVALMAPCQLKAKEEKFPLIATVCCTSEEGGDLPAASDGTFSSTSDKMCNGSKVAKFLDFNCQQ